ncbi:MAG TPA: hypothetical protein PLM16_02045 [Candidatus Woesebacteria bacterium]|nr:hypothetical protein [Candidatus Woesebacteria bacterium]
MSKPFQLVDYISDIKRFFSSHPFVIFNILLCILMLIALSKPIKLSSVDLGRHIANGRELVAGNYRVLNTNHYSYVMPEQPFINHHWLYGVIAFWISEASGLIGIQLFNAGVLIVALMMLVKIIERRSSPAMAAGLGLMAMWFIASRTEVRPECVGLLLMVNSLRIIDQVRQTGRLNRAQIGVLIGQQLIWVNLHISFVFGLFLIGLFTICSSWLKSPRLPQITQKKLWLISFLLAGCCLINPNGIRGALAPLTIFSDYGYAIVENQSLWFLWAVLRLPALIYFLIYFFFFLVISIFAWKKTSWFDRVLAITGFVMGATALRNLPIMIVFTLPLLASMLTTFAKKLASSDTMIFSLKNQMVGLIQCYLLILILILAGSRDVVHNRIELGWGADPLEAKAAEYITTHQLPQPIFNNYDLGSYLIYYLYPNYQVFTDNRPEAYNTQFFQKKYIPMQQDPEIWSEETNKMEIQTVIFGVQDITPWGRQFLSFIEQNPQWQRQYLDQYVGVWTKKEN